MSRSSLPVAINYPVTPPGPPLSPASAGGEASATTPTADLLDNAAVRLLADFFLLLAEWDAKQKNRNLGATLPDTPIHDCMSKADIAAAEPTRCSRPSGHDGVTRKVATGGCMARCTAREEVRKEVAA
jgi:hypothetical protein